MKEMLEAAERDYKTILRLWGDIGDEWAIPVVMYHFQQAIEKLLKVLIMVLGNKYPHTHDISVLVGMCNKADIPTELYELSDLLTTWEAKTRYGSSLLTNIKTLEQCKGVYNELHAIVLNKMTYTAYTLEDFLHDPDVLIAAIAKHKNNYEEWFNTTFPNGADSRDSVLEMLNKEEEK